MEERHIMKTYRMHAMDVKDKRPRLEREPSKLYTFTTVMELIYSKYVFCEVLVYYT
jgi:hypothetical protein